MFEIPIKELIVNSDDQVQLLFEDGTPYTDGDITALTEGFILQNFLTNTILVSDLVGAKADKISYVARAAAVKGASTFLVTSTSASVGASFTIELESVDGTPVHLQQNRYFKRYQIADNAGLDSAAKIAVAMETAINADEDALVTVSVSTATLTITAKDAGLTPVVYSSVILGTRTVTVPASVGNGNYENLINIQWNYTGVDYLENQEILPVKGATYGQWDFTVTAASLISGYGGQVPGEPNASGNYNFRLYVNTGTTLHTALTDMDGDIAAIV